MLEGPDFFELEGKFVLMMSPQGMNSTGNRYWTASVMKLISFAAETDFQEIDFGHDFYATQSTQNNRSRILIAWLGMWQDFGSNTTLVEHTYGRAGALTIFRNLTLKNNRIVMKPVDNMVELREGPVFNGTLDMENEITALPQTAELIVSANWSQIVELQFLGRDGRFRHI
ncbi:unnamed protein product [Arctia plantaginis]|uniref:Glycosyl hydrolase family 32 N-terminal domain-containing protein n=1 Tax=Arctia plantaginis TaxID=874455 RepID=A0A8S1B7B3_ARCPL|nr:unnamed protein product [Arctia plantaginis]